MKLLVICQHYTPEPFRLGDICEALVQKGHEVHVLTGLPNYPMGTIYEGYRHRERRNEKINGVSVHRCFTIPRRTGVFWRVLNYYSFSLSSTLYASRMKSDFDAVFVNQLSPVMMSRAGVHYCKKHRKKLVLYCLDLWPESLAAGGILKGSPIFALFKRVSQKIYRCADKIAITSKSFSKYFAENFGIHDTTYMPQYAESLFSDDACRKEPDEYIDLMFAGNVGVAQSVETIIHAAKLTEDVPNLRWHIVGEGTTLKDMVLLAEKFGLNRVIFHGRKPVEEMPRYYAMADAMLVTMKADPVFSLTLPGKIQSYMAAGKPILAAADGETLRVIEDADCGFACGSEDAERLAECVRAFVACDNKAQLGRNASSYYQENFTKDKFMTTLEALLNAQ